MSAGFLETASVVFIDYGNNTPDSNGNVDNSWSIADTAIPATLLPPILGFGLAHGVRGCIDLPVQLAEGQLDLTSPVVTSIIFAASVPIFVVLWWGPNDFILGDVNNTISVTLDSSMLTKVGACGVPGRILFEIASDEGTNFTWSWLQTATVQTPILGARRNKDRVELGWTSGPEATSTQIKRSTTQGGPYTLIDTFTFAPGVPVSYIDNNVTDGITYYYIAINFAGATPSLPSPEVSSTPFALNLSITNPGKDPFTLTWSAVPNIDYYSVFRSFNPGGPYTLDFTWSTTSVTISSNLTQPTYFVVTAHQSEINADSLFSNEVIDFAHVLANTLSGFGDINKDQLSWTSTISARSYNLYRGIAQGGPYTLIVNQSGLVYIDSVVTDGIKYYYVVTALVNGVEGPKSNELGLVPFALTLSGVSGSQTATLSWNSVPQASLYKLKRSLTSGGPYTVVNSANVLSFTDTGLAANTAYYYVVTAVTSQNGLTFESSNSNEVIVNPTQTLNFNNIIWDSPFDVEITSSPFGSLASQIVQSFKNSAFQSAQIQQSGNTPAAQAYFRNTGRVGFTGPTTAANLQVVLNTQVEAFVEDFTGGLFYVTVTSAQHGLLLHQDISQPVEFPIGTTNIPFTVPTAVGDTLTIVFNSNLAFPPFPAFVEEINWQIFLTPAQ